MATLTIRDLDDAVYERLKLRAAENHRSLEDEVAHLLDERSRSNRSFVETLRAANQDMIARRGVLSDSSEIIRQIRDEG
jgi:phosphopantothenoylcysteine decarboxylase/phosphopantothenate--cysteine ligase